MAPVKVRVLFFASLREVMGTEMIEIELIEGANFTDLYLELEKRFDQARTELIKASGVRIAVNQDLIHGRDLRLNEDDEIGFLPPVTGG